MVNQMKANVIGLIGARSGSKSIPKKNIKSLAGYPLIAYSIIASRLSKNIQRTIVSTDSQEFADVAKEYGAETPFLRPKEISGDKSLDIEYIRHVIKWFDENEGGAPEYIVMLSPPTPLRDPTLIDAAIEKIKKYTDATALRSAAEVAESPYKMFGIKEDYFVGLFPSDPRPEYYNLPRQTFPPVYHPNGYVDTIKTQTVKELGKLHGSRILSFVTPDVGELDRPEDYDYIEYLLQKKSNPVYEYLKNNYQMMR